VDEVNGVKRCGFAEVCYLADCLNCFGYKSDCPLYISGKSRPSSLADFHAAIDKLIQNTKVSYLEHDK
jgi:hypothetical protein